ncbi:hypothetical protein DVH05_003384 [Phytophthora capsici]|nr:hypothetical protein DVH05_003384 [Phytophthora capsici]
MGASVTVTTVWTVTTNAGTIDKCDEGDNEDSEIKDENGEGGDDSEDREDSEESEASVDSPASEYMSDESKFSDSERAVIALVIDSTMLPNTCIGIVLCTVPDPYCLLSPIHTVLCPQFTV